MFVRYSPVVSQKSLPLTFQGLNRKQGADKSAVQEKGYLQQQEDRDFLDLRSDWFKKHRPNDEADDGYVTTPGHSDEEYESENGTKPRPSARKRAREAKREFDSSQQIFRASTALDKQK